MSAHSILNLKKDLFRWKVEAYPALISAGCFSMSKTPYGPGWPKSEVIFIGRDCFWWSNWEDSDKNGRALIKKVLNKDSSDFNKEYYKKFECVRSNLAKQVCFLEKNDLKKLSFTKFKVIFNQFFKVYKEFWNIVIVPEVLAYAASRLLEAEIKKAKLELNNDDLSQLTVFSERSFLLDEEYELIKIAQQVIRGQDIRKSLAQHLNKYHWILNGYHGVREIDEQFFEGRLEELLASGNIEKKRQNLEKYTLITNKKFLDLIKKYKLNPRIIALAKLSGRAAYLQDIRKADTLKAMAVIVKKLYQRLADEWNLGLIDSLYINCAEINKWQKGEKLQKEINKRKIAYRLIMQNNKISFTADNVLTVENEIERAYFANEEKEIRGVVACSGNAQGRVKIIKSSQDMKYFNYGDILVTIMTSPDFVVVMKKAAAIITDEGGLTSHAAIISRELEKPCIVGTRSASRILKDGDLVEVDANLGVVRKI
jgi:phosphohistidine swiveling domain-containing protein